ncbi:MAG: SH3 domain-containing protein, partial [Candidatus Paceibacterales bacterium]
QSLEFAIKTTPKYQLLAQITLASTEAKNIAEGVVPTPAPVLQKVQITDTPQGFLRVRQDASASSVEVGRVKPGDQLELIQETDGWFQVKFEGKQGWISSQYAKKITI